MRPLSLLVVVFVWVWLSASTAQAATWYVTNAGAGVADGTSLAKAFAGWSGITMANINAGDTLKVCGTVSSATQMSFTRAGSSGSPITITGACVADGGTAGVLDGLNTATPNLLKLSEAGQDASWVNVEDLEIKNSGQNAGDSCVLASSLGAGPGHNTLSRLVVHHCGQGNGVLFQKPSPILQDSEVYDVGDDAVGYSIAATNAIIRRNYIHNFSTILTFGDGIACDTGTPSGALIQGNRVIFNVLTSIKQGIICGNNGTGTVVIEGNTITAPVATTANHAISWISGNASIRENIINGFSACIAHFTGTAVQVDLYGNVCMNSVYLFRPAVVAGTPLFNVYHNTALNVTNGVFATGTSTMTINHYNNIISLAGAGEALHVTAAVTTYNGNENIYHPEGTSFITNTPCGGGTYSTLAAYVAACAQEARSLASNPGLTATGQTLSSSIARLAAPLYNTFCIDPRGRICLAPADIGAYQGSNTLASTRTAVGGGLLASDAFDGTSATLGSNWSDNSTLTVFKLASDLATATSNANDAAARYSAITWPNDQRSYVLFAKALTSGGIGAGYGPAVRMSTSGTTKTYARFICSTAGWELGEKVNDVFASLASSATPACADGSVTELEASGSTLKAWINGVLVTTKTTSLITGAAGIAYSSTGGNDTFGITSWTGSQAGTPRRARQ